LFDLPVFIGFLKEKADSRTGNYFETNRDIVAKCHIFAGA